MCAQGNKDVPEKTVSWAAGKLRRCAGVLFFFFFFMLHSSHVEGQMMRDKASLATEL